MLAVVILEFIPQIYVEDHNKIIFKFFSIKITKTIFLFLFLHINFKDMSDFKEIEKEEKKSLNFIEAKVVEDLQNGKNDGRVQTRFPPEPNGYLHIGHAKAICLDFGIAKKYNGVCNLRFDDTNPTKEDVEYVDSIKEDIQWLGFQWANEYYASDYFQQLWDFAIRLIKEGKAYIDEQSSEEIAAQKGTPTIPGTESPYRNRPVEESLELFQKMNRGEIEEGKMVLRAKIDMANSNMHFRDPIIYRVVKTPHHRTGNTWYAYPMYDFAHGQSDYFEGVTHSLCTLEFVVHRPLYDYFIDELKEQNDLDDHRPRQYEFNKLNFNYTLLSKRNLLILVKEGLVNGWDDPRMPTICGFRRRGYTPESIHKLIDKIGYTTYEAVNDFALLESTIREDLNARATRVSAVINPVKLVITNYPEGQSEEMEAVNNPEDESAGMRKVPFTKRIYIEKSDFMENPPKKFFRLTIGNEVRLRYAYFMKCKEVIKDADGNVVKLICTIDPDSRGGNSPDGRKVKGTIHWVDAKTAVEIKVRNYDYLMIDDENGEQIMNPESVVETIGYAEPMIKEAKPGERFQFFRKGYYIADEKLTTDDEKVFNKIVGLKSSWKPAK